MNFLWFQDYSVKVTDAQESEVILLSITQLNREKENVVQKNTAVLTFKWKGVVQPRSPIN